MGSGWTGSWSRRRCRLRCVLRAAVPAPAARHRSLRTGWGRGEGKGDAPRVCGDAREGEGCKRGRWSGAGVGAVSRAHFARTAECEQRELAPAAGGNATPRCCRGRGYRVGGGGTLTSFSPPSLLPNVSPPPFVSVHVEKGAKSDLGAGGRCSIVILANSSRGGAGRACQITPVHRAAGGWGG